MLLLTSPSDRIRLVTDAAVPVDVHASYLDSVDDVVTPARQNTAITTATTTEIVLGPASGTRSVKTIHVRNRHATDPVTVTVQHTDGTTVVQVGEAVLAAGEKLAYVDGEGFRQFDVDGKLR